MWVYQILLLDMNTIKMRNKKQLSRKTIELENRLLKKQQQPNKFPCKLRRRGPNIETPCSC